MKIPSPFLLLAFASIIQADDLPDPAVVSAAMRKANDYYVSQLASHGGYASSWKTDLSLAFAEGKESKTILSIQPPGMTTVGMAMLKSWQATGDEAFLEGAKGAARALLDCQLESGGWPADFDFEGEDPEKWWLRQEVAAGVVEKGKQSNSSTLDDNKSQSALLFLLELAHDPSGRDDAALHEAVTYALYRLLAAQTKIGSWPQQFSEAAPTDGIVKKAVIPAEWPREFPKEKYTNFHTLNDGNLQKIVELMLRAHQLTGEARYLAAAKRCGDFLLLAQFEGDQPAWAQQYNQEMVPVWARKFEPPAVSSTESLGACFTLFEIWLATGEEKYRTTIPAALDWLEQAKLPNGRWSRFYEFGTNRPLYCVAETYELTYDDSSLPDHYGFQPEYGGEKIERLRSDLAKPREELLTSRKGPDSPERWMKAARNLRGKVKTALETQNKNGVWIDDDRIDAELFVKHLNAMSAYVAAMKYAEAKP
ncbi:MAG: pectate lyase [Verrucomicrobiales bacterium]|nr:pectate lyase [Verrucomicrobiales bacterium]